MITGSTKETNTNTGFTKYIGFFKGHVVEINPTRDKLNKLLGNEEDNDKEIEYLGEKEGVDTVNLTFWLRVDGWKDLLLPHRIRLRNEVRRNNNGDKIQLINSVGDTTWVEADENNEFDESLLKEMFTDFSIVKSWRTPDGEVSEKYKNGAKPHETESIGKKQYRPALYGEEDLAEFMKAWLSKIDLRKADANILVDTKALFKGNYKELTSLINSEYDSEVKGGDLIPVGMVGNAFVRIDEENTDKVYQQIYKNFLPANFMRYINNGCKFDQYTQKRWDKYTAELTGEHGIRGEYILEPLKEYDPEMETASHIPPAENVTETNSRY